VHLRNGLDPRNVRLGLSPLTAELRDIFTDDEAAAYTATMLKNRGVPGLLIAPDSDNAVVSDEEAQAMRAKVEERTTGSNRGRPIVPTGKTKVTRLASRRATWICRRCATSRRSGCARR